MPHKVTESSWVKSELIRCAEVALFKKEGDGTLALHITCTGSVAHVKYNIRLDNALERQKWVATLDGETKRALFIICGIVYVVIAFAND